MTSAAFLVATIASASTSTTSLTNPIRSRSPRNPASVLRGRAHLTHFRRCVKRQFRRLAGLAIVGVLLAGCGEDDKQRDAAKKSEPMKSSEKVRVCAEQTGQDIFAKGAPVDGFVACLKRLDAPASVVRAWTP